MEGLAEDPVRSYLDLPYRIALVRDGREQDRPWLAAIEELPGCEVRGTTAADAASRMPAALADWVANAVAAGREVPEPRDARAYSGKLLLRMPQSLHGDLAAGADRDQISLNAYINGLLAAAIRWRMPEGAEPDERAAPGPWNDDAAEAAAPASSAARLQRFLAVALAANVAVVAIAAAIAIVLLISAN